MAEISREHDSGDGPALLNTVLAEQQSLTAVEMFAEVHDRGMEKNQGRYYRSLLPDTLPEPGEQYAFEVDLDRCTGCKACVTGCHNLNGLDADETWRSVGLIHGEERSKSSLRPASFSDLKLQPEHPGARVEQGPSCGTSSAKVKFPSAPHLTGSVRHDPVQPSYYQQNITTACHHCADPSCLNGCPVRAYEKDAVTGIVRHLPDQCIGCKYCIFKCAYGVPQYSEKRGIVRKCDMCAGRLKSGEAPACVQSCPNEAIRIAVVKRDDICADPGKYFQIPSSPSPHYSMPMTRYVTEREIPLATVAADSEALRAQPAEYPLVFMLVLTQGSAGAFAAMALLQDFLRDESRSLFLTRMSAMGLVAGLAGLGLSLLHLGRPMYAFRAFLGFRTSWLSREVVFFGLFMKLAFLYTALCWVPLVSAGYGEWIARFLPWGAVEIVGLIAAAAGLTGVFASGMIYKDTPRVWWSSWQTVAKFFLTAGILGSALTITLFHFLGRKELFRFDPSELFCFVFAASAGLKFLLETQILSRTDDESDDYLRKTARLFAGRFKKMVNLRFALLFGGGLAMSVPFAGWTPSFSASVSGAGLALLIAGECVERHLFFRAVVPPKMPGTVESEL